jgi:Protein of unknown function (DUF1064)
MDKKQLAAAVAHLEAQGARQSPEVHAYLSASGAPAPAATKFHNVATEVDGIRFDSKAEAHRYGELKLLVRVGYFTDLVCHPRFLLLEKAKGRRAMYYEADFSYRDGGRQVVEDVKGGRATQTALFKAKAKLFQARYPEIVFRIVER